MLLTGYRKELFRPDCNPGFQTVGWIAYPDQDVMEVIPDLNAELGGSEYFKEPPAVTFRLQRIILAGNTLHYSPNWSLKNENKISFFQQGRSVTESEN